MVQQAESSRRATILGMQQGVMAGVNMNYQQQLMNQAKANQAATQMELNALKSISQLPLEDMFSNNSPRSGGFLDADGNEVSVMPGYEGDFTSIPG